MAGEGGEGVWREVLFLQQDHLFAVNLHLDVDGIIDDIVQRVQDFKLNKLLSAKRGVTIASRSAQERRVLFARVGLDGVADVAP